MRYVRHWMALLCLSLLLAACGGPGSAPAGRDLGLPANPSAVPLAESAPSPAAYPTPEAAPTHEDSYPTPGWSSYPFPSPTAMPGVESGPALLLTAGPLLKTLWSAPPGIAPVTSLLYAEHHDSSFEPFYSVWRVNPADPAQPEAVITITPRESDWSLRWSTYAELSPDGEWIAYQSNGQEDKTLTGNSLVVMRPDGSDRTIVADGLTSDGNRGNRRFAWSGSGRQLALIRHWSDPATQTFGQEFIVYRPDLAGEPQLVARLRNGVLVGWRDETTLLILTIPELRAPLSLAELNVQTQELEVIAPLSTDFAELAPDRSAVLVNIDGRARTFDLVEKRLRKLVRRGAVTFTARDVIWSADSLSLLLFPASLTESAALVKRTAIVVSPIRFDLPAYAAGLDGFKTLGVSPDDAYLVICDPITFSDDSSVRTRIYSVADHQWATIHPSRCVEILGWQ